LVLSKSSPDPVDRWAWRFCYWSAAVAIWAWAAWQRFALPADPIADPDSWGYLSPALRQLAGAGYIHIQGRNFIYPEFLFLLLRGFGNLHAITTAQHLLGLIAGGVLLLTWRRIRVVLPNPRVARVIYDAMGLLASAIFLFATDQIHFETRIRPEGVCAFLISLNLYVVVQFVICGLIEDRRIASVGYGVAIVFSSILVGSVKPSCLPVVFVAVMPPAFFLMRRDRGWQKIVLVGGAVASALLLLLPEHFLSRNDEKSRTFLPTTLFVMHANLIRDQMADDLQRGAILPYSREWLSRVHASLSTEMTKSAAAGRQFHVSNGFSPDYLMYHPASIAAQLRRDFGDDVSALCAFYRFYYWRLWQHRPLSLLRKIGRQLSIFYAPTCPAYDRAKVLPLADEYQRSLNGVNIAAFQQILSVSPPELDVLNRISALSQKAPMIEQPVYSRVALDILAATYLPLLLVTVGVSGFAFLSPGWRNRFGPLAALVLLVLSYNFANCFELAVIHLLEYARHITVQMYFTLLAQFVEVWFIAEFCLELRSRSIIANKKEAASK
jgi:hypothetical protein